MVSRGADVANTKARKVIDRVQKKLAGTEFFVQEGSSEQQKQTPVLSVEQQLKRLVRDATNHENLCQHYTGWCSFW